MLLSLPKDDYNRITAAATAEDQKARARHLSMCPIFATWRRDKLETVARRAVVKLYDAHSVIIREDAARAQLAAKEGSA